MSDSQVPLQGQRLSAIQQLKSQNFAAARDAFHELASETGLGSDLRWRAMCHLLCGEYADALIDLDAVLKQHVACAFSHLAIAYIRATSPSQVLRNGHLAAQFAERGLALIREPTWRTYSVVAAAYAEDGDFDQAVLYAEKMKEACPDHFRDMAVRKITDYTLELTSTTSLADLRECMGFLQYTCKACGEEAFMVWMGEDAHVDRLCSDCSKSQELD